MTSPQATGAEAERPRPEQVALAWLALVDAGDARASWRRAATFFRSMVKETQWAQSVQRVRQSLGRVVARRLTSATPATELPGAPDGQYLVLQFETEFEHKQSAVETVTPMLDVDGVWRVSGYFVR